jgi:sulfatase maturation enzyme AslB (radical SAM superfamily)
MRSHPASDAKERSDGPADFDGDRGDHNRPSDGVKPKRTIDRLKYVVKLSKYCNLRCSYCYEFEDLHKKERMDLGQIQKMFLNILAHAVEYSVKSVEFIWHGGEPLLFKWLRLPSRCSELP